MLNAQGAMRNPGAGRDRGEVGGMRLRIRDAVPGEVGISVANP